MYPKGYLKGVYEKVRSLGGVCVADEVQTGFGRCGTHYWGYETHDVVPDMVVMAKGIGNGFPMAAVVTTKEIASHMSKVRSQISHKHVILKFRHSTSTRSAEILWLVELEWKSSMSSTMKSYRKTATLLELIS